MKNMTLRLMVTGILVGVFVLMVAQDRRDSARFKRDHDQAIAEEEYLYDMHWLIICGDGRNPAGCQQAIKEYEDLKKSHTPQR